MSKNDEKIVFQPQTEAIYKVIILGDPSVGKTSLLTKFSTKKFETKYLPTVGVQISKEVLDLKIDGNDVTVNLMLWDVAGQPQFYMLHKPYFNGADGMMLVFDITRSSTFSNVKNWYNTTVKFGLSGVPKILIGNKIDLKDERKIIQPHATHLSDELNAHYFETSAKSGENVKDIFESIAREVYLFKTRK
jgi:small GTP-binding protein